MFRKISKKGRGLNALTIFIYMCFGAAWALMFNLSKVLQNEACSIIACQYKEFLIPFMNITAIVLFLPTILFFFLGISNYLIIVISVILAIPYWFIVSTAIAALYSKITGKKDEQKNIIFFYRDMAFLFVFFSFIFVSIISFLYYPSIGGLEISTSDFITFSSFIAVVITLSLNLGRDRFDKKTSEILVRLGMCILFIVFIGAFVSFMFSVRVPIDESQIIKDMNTASLRAMQNGSMAAGFTGILFSFFIISEKFGRKNVKRKKKGLVGIVFGQLLSNWKVKFHKYITKNKIYWKEIIISIIFIIFLFQTLFNYPMVSEEMLILLVVLGSILTIYRFNKYGKNKEEFKSTMFIVFITLLLGYLLFSYVSFTEKQNVSFSLYGLNENQTITWGELSLDFTNICGNKEPYGKVKLTIHNSGEINHPNLEIEFPEQITGYTIKITHRDDVKIIENYNFNESNRRAVRLFNTSVLEGGTYEIDATLKMKAGIKPKIFTNFRINPDTSKVNQFWITVRFDTLQYSCDGLCAYSGSFPGLYIRTEKIKLADICKIGILNIGTLKILETVIRGESSSGGTYYWMHVDTREILNDAIAIFMLLLISAIIIFLVEEKIRKYIKK